MIINKKVSFFILLLLGLISFSFNKNNANLNLSSNVKCTTDWIVDSLNIQIGISNCNDDSNRYEVVIVAKDYFQDTVLTRNFEIREISFIDVIDNSILSHSRFILKNGIIAIPIKSFIGLKICFVDLKCKKVKDVFYGEQIWTDKSLVYNSNSSIFRCEYEIRSSRSFRHKEFLWNGDSISLLKQW